MDKISVIIPCRNEENYIKECLNSVVASDYDKNDIEVFVVDGMSSDSTIHIVTDFVKKYSYIKLLPNEKKIVPFALNKAIKESKGKYIFRIDAHAKYPANYFSELVEWSKKLDADNIGTVCTTDVKNNNKKSNSIKKILSNKFGVGNSLFRIGIKDIQEVDNVPFGCYKREVFEKVGFFDERLVRDQDIELNKRIKKSGGKIFLLPHIYSIYYARDTFGAFAKNNFQTGLWNLYTVYLTRKLSAISIRHFIPLLFLLSILIPSVFSLFNIKLLLVPMMILMPYFLIIFSVSIKLADSESSIFYLLFSFMIIHFSYGIGSLIGLLRVDLFFRKGKR